MRKHSLWPWALFFFIVGSVCLATGPGKLNVTWGGGPDDPLCGGEPYNPLEQGCCVSDANVETIYDLDTERCCTSCGCNFPK